MLNFLPSDFASEDLLTIRDTQLFVPVDNGDGHFALARSIVGGRAVVLVQQVAHTVHHTVALGVDQQRYQAAYRENQKFFHSLELINPVGDFHGGYFGHAAEMPAGAFFVASLSAGTALETANFEHSELMALFRDVGIFPEFGHSAAPYRAHGFA